MLRQPRPRSRLRSLTVWSFGVGLVWLLIGQQLNGQPVVQLDLTTRLPGAPSVHGRQAAPPAQHQRTPAPRRRASPQTSQAPARAVAFALSQRGKPYELGAEGPDAYDCSGLAWRAWRYAGLNWDRMTAAGQWQWLHQHGQDVLAAQLRPGDLLFYAYDPSDPASIHHVAMAIGNGRMVEAPQRGVPVREVLVRWDGFYAAARPAA
jgi:cell wall-associated NlpC family hydrolase